MSAAPATPIALRRRAPARMVRCVIVEDQTMFLQLLTGMLRTVPGIEITATATTLAAAIDACGFLPPDLLILDLVLPDGNGIDALRAAVNRCPDVEGVVLSSAASEFVCPADLLRNLRAVIDKTQAYEQLQAIIAEIVRERGAAGTPASAGPDPIAVLRPREIEVFRSIGMGLKTTDISDRMGISRHTVETHRKNIASKLGASGAQLVRLATIHNQTSLDLPRNP